MENRKTYPPRRISRRPRRGARPGRTGRRENAPRTRTGRRETAPYTQTGRRETAPYTQTHRRGRSISRSASLVAGLFFCFVLVYLARMFYDFLEKPDVTTEIVRLGSLDIPGTAAGVIIRDETVYAAGREGRVNFYINDYDRVKPGQSVCAIQNMEEVERINLSMMSIDDQIFEIQRMRRDISQADPAVQRVNAQIKNMVDERMHQFMTLNTAEVYTLKDSVAQNISIRNQMIFNDNQNAKTDLSAQKQILMDRLNQHVTVIAAAMGGIMSPVVDGMEDVYTLDNRNDLSREEIARKTDYNKLIPLKDVTAGDPVFKIINSSIWYIAAYMPNEMVEGYAEGDTRTLYVETKNGYIPLAARVDRLSPGYRDTYTVFRFTKYMTDFLNTRNINIKTSDATRKGLKISNTAVANRVLYKIPADFILGAGQQRYVLRRNGEGEDVIPVRVMEQDAEFAYISDAAPVSLGDVVTAHEPVTRVYAIADTKTVQGVYRINSGYAEFKKITLDADYSTASAFTVLNPSLEQGIRAYDNIVTNAAAVTDGQIISKFVNQ